MGQIYYGMVATGNHFYFNSLPGAPPSRATVHRTVAFRWFESHRQREDKKKGYQMVSFLFLGWVMGLEPTTPGTTIRCSAN